MNDDYLLGLYILVGKAPVRVKDTLEWARWLGQFDRHVAKTDVDECWVSTVFLGLDHNHSRRGPPLLFETMAFGPLQPSEHFGGRLYRPEICSMDRYSTWDQAAAGHEKIVAEVRAYCLETAVKADEALLAIARKARA